MDTVIAIITASWELLRASAFYILFGLLISGFLKIFLNPGMVVGHLGTGRFLPVFKAALLGVPIPLCSCGVLPASLTLKKQGANNGATTAFMIATPESGIDSIAITYALLDPIMTVARPVAAFLTAAAAGIAENLCGYRTPVQPPASEFPSPSDGSTVGSEGSSTGLLLYSGWWPKVQGGIRYAFAEFWGYLAGWFFLGVLLAGLITTLIPDDVFMTYLGAGLPAKLLMLAVGIPLYICATASTPIAAALILKGVSPGAALVFLLAGSATNIASLTVLTGVLGKRAAAIYLAAIAVCAVVFGMVLDWFYVIQGLSATAMVGQAAEIMPGWLEWPAVVILLAISVKPVFRGLMSKFRLMRRFRSFRTFPVPCSGDD